MSLVDDAQEFLNFYLHGSELGNLSGAFPGIRRRQPAAVGEPPEYEALPAALDEFDSLLLEVAQQPPMRADFNPRKVMMLDLCGAERVVVLDTPPGLEIVLIWVTDYPASEFPSIVAVQTDGRIVTADAAQPSAVVLNECLNRLWEFVAEDLAEVVVESRIVECSFEELDRVEQRVKSREI